MPENLRGHVPLGHSYLYALLLLNLNCSYFVSMLIGHNVVNVQLFLNLGRCSNYQISNITSSSRSACNPISLSVTSIKIRSDTGKYLPYALLTWKPCAAGLQDLKGYLVSISERRRRLYWKVFYSFRKR